MKFIGIVAVFAASALAQRIAIGAPPPGSDISPGQSLTVEVDRPVSPCHPRLMCLDLRSFAILGFPHWIPGGVGCHRSPFMRLVPGRKL